MYIKQEELKPEEKPSFLIRDALDALEEAAKNENIVIDMEHFRSIRGDICLSCLGGSQRLKRMGLLDADIKKLSEASLVPVDRVESSLDCVRRGHVDSMFIMLELSAAEGKKFNRIITHFDLSESRFKGEMSALADDLDAAGW